MAKLDKYIKKELRKGISKARIKSALIQAGYKKEDINHSFQRLFPKKPMPPSIKYIVIALVLVIVGATYGALISDILEHRPIVVAKASPEPSQYQANIFCHAIFEEDFQYYLSRVNLTEYSIFSAYMLSLSIYKQDASVLEDPYVKEMVAKHKEVAELFEPMKPVLKSIINKEITSSEQCADRFCEHILEFNEAIVEANLGYCNKLVTTICHALITKNRNICDEVK